MMNIPLDAIRFNAELSIQRWSNEVFLIELYYWYDIVAFQTVKLFQHLWRLKVCAWTLLIFLVTSKVIKIEKV